MNIFAKLVFLTTLFFSWISLDAVNIEFNLVHPQSFSINRQIKAWVKNGNPLGKFQLPPNYRLVSETYNNQTDYYLLELKSALTINQYLAVEKPDLEQPTRDVNSIAVLAIDLTPEDTLKFAKLTRANINRQLAISIDGIFCCAPIIREEIKGGRISISGAASLINHTYKQLKKQLAPPENASAPVTPKLPETPAASPKSNTPETKN